MHGTPKAYAKALPKLTPTTSEPASPRTACDRNRLNVDPTETGPLKRGVRHLFNRLNVLSRRQFRDHAAEPSMHLMLGRDDVRQQPALEGQRRGSRFIARGFDAQETRGS